MAGTNFTQPFCIVEFTPTETKEIWCVKDGAVVNNGGLVLPVRTVEASANVTGADYTVLVNASAASVPVFLPTNLTTEGNIYNIKKIDAQANTVLINGNGNTIDGVAIVTIASPQDNIPVQWDRDATSWRIL